MSAESLRLAEVTKTHLRRILVAGGKARAERFIDELDLRLWMLAYDRETRTGDPWLTSKRIKARSPERQQLEKLHAAALAIVKVMDHPAGDIEHRLEDWYPRDRLTNDALQLLMATDHILGRTRIEHGTANKADKNELAPYLVLVRVFRVHYSGVFAIGATEGGILDHVAFYVFPKNARRLLERAIAES